MADTQKRKSCRFRFRFTSEYRLASEGARSVVAGGEIEASPLIIAEVEAVWTSALIAADRVPTISRAANVRVRALVVVHALVPISMLRENKGDNF